MIGVGMAFVWLAVVMLGLIASAVVERRVRLASLRGRDRWAPQKADWGFDAERPPVVSLLARGLAGAARLVRSRTSVRDQSPKLRWVGRFVSCVAMTSALALVPFAGTWGGRVEGQPLLAVDLPHGLIAVAFLVLMTGLAQVGVGLAERSPWSRLGSVGLASQLLGGFGLFVLVLAPLVLGPFSFRLQDIVSFQQTTFSLFFWLPESLQGEGFEFLRAVQWPRWNLFVQPLTAILFLPALYFLTHRPWVAAGMTRSVGTAGLGLDSDPRDLYWGRLETRLAEVFAAALFVALFLGAESIPFLPVSILVGALEPLVGFALPALLAVVLGIGVFLGKLVIVLVLVGVVHRSTADLRGDQKLRLVALRLLPLAWGNLLLMSAIHLAVEPVPEAIVKSLSGGG